MTATCAAHRFQIAARGGLAQTLPRDGEADLLGLRRLLGTQRGDLRLDGLSFRGELTQQAVVLSKHGWKRPQNRVGRWNHEFIGGPCHRPAVHDAVASVAVAVSVWSSDAAVATAEA